MNLARIAGSGGSRSIAHAAAVLTAFVGLALPASALADDTGGVIVRYKTGTTASERLNARQDAGVTRAAGLGLSRLELVDPGPGVNARQAIRALERDPDVAYAEPDRIRHAVMTPNDTLFGNEWGLTNTGQSPPTSNPRIAFSTSSGNDIDASHAWDLTTGSANVVVAVIDTGVDAAHPDLAPNLWTNPREVAGNGIDDDGNGFRDDTHGWDFVANDNTPSDQTAPGGNPGHGTHVSGTLGARGNDGGGIAGVSWSESIMPVRVLDATGSGSLSQVLAGYNYAGRNGARIVNLSLGDFAPSQAERDTISSFPNTLFLVAAGNDGANTDSGDAATCAQIIQGLGPTDPPPTQCSFPCNYGLANVVCVAATDGNDALADFSNRGTRFVDLAAPGVRIWSSLPSTACSSPPCFGDLSGTSMATPHVTGTAALLLARDPELTTAPLRDALVTSVTKRDQLSGQVKTGGRLNAAAAIAAGDLLAHPPAPPPPPPPPAPPVTVAAQSTAPAKDIVAPVLTLQLARTVRAGRGLRVKVHCSEGCSLTYAAVLDARSARRLHVRRTAARGSGKLLKASSQTVTLRLPKALRRLRRGTLTLRVMAVDAAGNGVARNVTVKLTR